MEFRVVRFWANFVIFVPDIFEEFYLSFTLAPEGKKKFHHLWDFVDAFIFGKYCNKMFRFELSVNHMPFYTLRHFLVVSNVCHLLHTLKYYNVG